MDDMIISNIVFLPQFLLTFFFFCERIKLRYKEITAYLLFLSVELLLIFVYLFTDNLPLYNILKAAALLSAIFLLFQESLKKKLLNYFICLFISIVSSELSTAICSHILNFDYSQVANIDPLQYQVGIMICTDMFAIITFIYCIISQHISKNVSTKEQIIVMLQFMIIHFVLMIFYFNKNSDSLSEGNNITLFVFQFIIIIMSTINYYISVRNKKLIRIEEEKKNIEKELQFTYKYYESANDKYTEVSKIRHDIINQLSVYSNLLHNGHESDADTLLQDIKDKLNQFRTVHYCEEPVINSLLTVKMNETANKNIDYDIVLNDIQNANIDKYDLCSLFANLIDNAIEACLNMPESICKFIRIRSSFKRDYFVVTVENSADNNLTIDNNEFVSSKKSEDHGYGTKIIKSIADKYNGIFNLEKENDLVTATVLLKVN